MMSRSPIQEANLSNTLEFDNLTITVNTSNIIPFWEDRVKS